MESPRDEFDLATELRALRPTPRPEFTAALDARSATGFPGEGRGRLGLTALSRKLRLTPPRRLLVPVGAAALSAIVIATAVIAVSDEEHGSSTGMTPPHAASDRLTAPRSGHSTPSASAAEEGATSASGASEMQYSAPLPPSAPQTSRDTAGIVPRTVERDAQIVLGADPADVRSDAAKVFEAVHAADGVVLRSSIRDGNAGDAGATFALLIPSAKLGDAMAAFSAIGEVRARHEATQDITAPTVSAAEQLRDSRARIDGLLVQLAAAATDEERGAVEAELRVERRQAAALRARLAGLNRRADLSRVSLRIETSERADSGEVGGTWGVGDGFRSAGQILATAGGVTLVGLAILTPFALIGLLAWLARRTWLMRARKRALA